MIKFLVSVNVFLYSCNIAYLHSRCWCALWGHRQTMTQYWIPGGSSTEVPCRRPVHEVCHCWHDYLAPGMQARYEYGAGTRGQLTDVFVHRCPAGVSRFEPDLLDLPPHGLSVVEYTAFDSHTWEDLSDCQPRSWKG